MVWHMQQAGLKAHKCFTYKHVCIQYQQGHRMHCYRFLKCALRSSTQVAQCVQQSVISHCICDCSKAPVHDKLIIKHDSTLCI